MNDVIVMLFLDVTVATLLAVTIFFCIKLNKRVQLLQDSKSELAQLIKEFDESTKQATVSINEIHKASKKINENIQVKLDKANYLADDLAFMIERANKTADRIEQQISTGRQASGNQQQTTRMPASSRSEERQSSGTAPAETNAEPARGSANIREKMARLESMPQRQSPPPTPSPVSTAAPQDKKGIEAMMERISELRAGKENASARPQRPAARLRTRTEQDLMQALNKKDTKG